LFNLTLVAEHAHADDQSSELLLVDHSILVQVKSFEVLVELLQEAFVLSELEVKNYLLKVSVQ
jgi:hypothetical protein